jgi:SAM-dependent methyltransferase
MTTILSRTHRAMPIWLLEALLTLRALLYVGNKYTCPCCGWKLRAFTDGGTSFRTRELSYCPRCDAKARHRRDWLYLREKTNLFSDPLRLFHVAPSYGLSRRFARMPNLDYVGVDIQPDRNISISMDLVATAIRSNTFDAAICIHVLEHIREDRIAMQEIYRLLKPGGWALISVPIRLDQKTFEDPSVKGYAERKRLFGEGGHVRYYGYDLAERLEECGFQVNLHLGKDVEQSTREKYGLRDDENIFFCTKARAE